MHGPGSLTHAWGRQEWELPQSARNMHVFAEHSLVSGAGSCVLMDSFIYSFIHSVSQSTNIERPTLRPAQEMQQRTKKTNTPALGRLCGGDSQDSGTQGIGDKQEHRTCSMCDCEMCCGKMQSEAGGQGEPQYYPYFTHVESTEPRPTASGACGLRRPTRLGLAS